MAINAAVLGAGFIGQNFIRLALQSGDILRVLDHKECPKEFEGRLTWIKGDLGDENAVRTCSATVRGYLPFHIQYCAGRCYGRRR